MNKLVPVIVVDNAVMCFFLARQVIRYKLISQESSRESQVVLLHLLPLTGHVTLAAPVAEMRECA